jgi:hypothetical protein
MPVSLSEDSEELVLLGWCGVGCGRWCVRCSGGERAIFDYRGIYSAWVGSFGDFAGGFVSAAVSS